MGLYDPGANITMVPLHFFKRLPSKMYTSKPLTFRTMSGEDKIKGIAYIKIKIFNITKKTRVFVIDNKDFKYDILIGLDTIKEYKLCQDHELNITQANTELKLETIDHSNGEIKINWNEHIPIEKFEIKTAHLDANQHKQVYELIDKHGSLFAKNQYDIGTVSEYEAHIKLVEDRYVAKKPYRCSYDDQKEIEKQIGELLNHGIIEESCSPFAAPVTLAYKKTGENNKREKTRLCVDFRELNKLLVPESQPFPLIEDIIVKTRDCKWFSALDINMAFWTIPICVKDRYKTGFVTQNGHWQWVTMPFGLKTSPAIFQRILSGIIRRNGLADFCCNYIDDILIFSKTFEQHMGHLEALMRAIHKEGFKLKFIKCSFATNSIQYLGHIIENNAVRPLNDNLIAIKNFPTPKNQKNIRQFLGKINFYHKYIQNAAKTLDIFHNLLRKDVKFVWTQQCQDAFERIKNYLISSPVLAIFDRNLPIVIYTDASKEGIGAILKQPQHDGMEKPVAYFSKKLNESQKKQKAIYIESLAIKEAVKYWRYWLIGRHFKIITDHKPLENLKLKARTDEELGDLANYLLQYDFEIIYRSGTDNAEADCLSRNPVLESDYNNDDYEPLCTANLLELQDIRNSQKNIIKGKRDILKNGIILRKIKEKERIIIDKNYGMKLVKMVHLQNGHIGPKHIINTIKNYYYFHNMYKGIHQFCSTCDICLKNKSRRIKQTGFLGHLGPASKPFQIMSIDTIGGFGGNKSTKRYLHLLVDHFTRFVYISTSPNQTASEFIKLTNQVQNYHQIGTLLTDQYAGLSSKEFTEYLQENNINHLYTALDHPASNGLNERLNQTLVNRIRCRINENKRKIAWTSIARRCAQEYNNTIHSVTKYTPNYLMNGVLPDLAPKEFLRVPNFQQDMSTAFTNSIKSHEENKKRYDSKRKAISLEIGDNVYVENGNKLNRNKLDEIRLGPFRIINKISNSVYQVDVGHGNKVDKRLYHISKIIKVHDQGPV